VYITDLGSLFDFLGVLVFNDHLTDLFRVLNITAPLGEYLDGDSDDSLLQMVVESSQKLPLLGHVCIDGGSRVGTLTRPSWATYLCTEDSRHGRDIVVDCVTLQSKPQGSAE
jgi:hypothetical protein